MTAKEKAYQLLKDWKKEDYIFGLGVFHQIGELVSHYGKNVLVISGEHHMDSLAKAAISSIEDAGGVVTPHKVIYGPMPNAPKEDVYRLQSCIMQYQPDCVVVIGGGSAIDGCKAAIALAVLWDRPISGIDQYFGTGMITEEMEKSGRKMIPLIAVQTAASSGAHLTKYSNITDLAKGQKKLIVDMAVVPAASIFDYETTITMPPSVSVDGVLDAISHTFEVFCGANAETYELKKELALTTLELALTYAQRIIENPRDREAREAIGLATDLGGYAIMVGGTSGAHLTSFSLVDLTAHGTACGIMNPYYAVFYSPAIQKQLAAVGEVLHRHGFIGRDVKELQGRELAIAVAEGLIAFGKSIHAPTKLKDLPGFSLKHVERILSAAKDPQLAMKLQNMPVSMTAEDVDVYMAPIIRCAAEGNLEGIINK